jgi:hypothetical protein
VTNLACVHRKVGATQLPTWTHGRRKQRAIIDPGLDIVIIGGVGWKAFCWREHVGSCRGALHGMRGKQFPLGELTCYDHSMNEPCLFSVDVLPTGEELMNLKGRWFHLECRTGNSEILSVQLTRIWWNYSRGCKRCWTGLLSGKVAAELRSYEAFAKPQSIGTE